MIVFCQYTATVIAATDTAAAAANALLAVEQLCSVAVQSVCSLYHVLSVLLFCLAC
jgi:hypothetical protein